MTEPREPSTSRSISQDQDLQIRSGPGYVVNPVELPSATELGDLNNFWFHFSDSEVGEAYRQTPYYMRFEILFPVLDAELKRRLPLETWEAIDPILREAYEHMRKCVDAQDPQVIKDGQVNPHLLIG